MTKTLFEYYSEEDDEFALEISSCKDIQKSLDEVKLALMRFDLRSFEVGGVTPMTNSEDFAWAGLTNVYKIEAIVGFIPRGGLEEIAGQVALFLNLPTKCVVVKSPDYKEEEPKEPDEDAPAILSTPLGEHPRDRQDDDAQKMVGQGRIFDHLAELDKQRKANEDERAEKLKHVLATHIAVKEIIGESLPKGYYDCLIEGNELKVLGKAEKDWRKAICSKEEFFSHLRRRSYNH